MIDKVDAGIGVGDEWHHPRGGGPAQWHPPKKTQVTLSWTRGHSRGADLHVTGAYATT